jgi:hypothetical protein
VRAIGGEDDHRDLVVARRSVDGVVELIEEIGVLRVARVGPSEPDARHLRRGLFVADRGRSFFAHPPTLAHPECS